MTGQTINHYKILEKLGEGGMGVVYKAHDTNLDRSVALKFLPAHLSSSGEDKTRFLQEARSAASLSHPNICTIFAIEEFTEAGKTESQFFFAMEFVEGKTLRHSVKDVPLQRALDIGSQVAEGLAAAHDKGIVHRDIKAENIMARPDGRVQIMDFGLAKVKGGSQLTKAGSTVGTIGYMSPEQIQGMDVDHRADIFSLGVLLYEMAAGHLPFRGVHDAAIMYEIVNVQPQHPSEVRPDLPSELARIILKCLAKDPEERYQSARDIAVDLKVLRKRSGSGITTTVSSTSSQPDPSEGHAAVPGSGGQGSGSSDSSTSGNLRAGSSGSSTETIRAPKRKPALYGAVGFMIIIMAVALWFTLGRDSSGTISSMVVLPFENVGADPDLEYLSDGVTEGIINKVSRIPELRVIPRSASFQFKGSGKDPKTIGEELGVDAVLSGRVVQRGDRLDLTLELIDVKEYSQLWGESYKRTMNDLMTVQEEIVREVTGNIRSGTSLPTEHTEKSETDNPTAYRLYLQGKFHWNKRTAPDLERALSYFKQAISLDPGFARAHLGLAETYLLQDQYSDKNAADMIMLSESEARMALELDNSLGEAHATLGMVREDHWDWEGAEREFKLAIEKAPDYATSYHWYRIYLQIVGRYDEALEVIKKGVELDPYSPIILANLAASYLFFDDFVSAQKVIDQILEIEPQFFFANLWQATILNETGRTEEGLAVLDQMNLADRSSNNLGYVAHQYAAFGRPVKADSILTVLLSNPNSDPVAIAMIYAGKGDVDSTLTWLEMAAEMEQKSRTLAQTREWREFRLIQNEPRFLAIMKKMGL